MKTPKKTKPRLLILGAGIFQLAAIRRAKAIGCHVITVDNNPESPGHLISDESICCSTTDVEEIVKIANSLHLDGVYSMASDVAIPAVAAISESLGLPGPTSNEASVLTQKDRFRKFQSDHRLGGPSYYVLEADRPFPDKQAQSSGEVVVKPVATSGSRGISLCSLADSSSLQRAVVAARQSSNSNRVCIEAYVPGDSATAEGIIYNGKVDALCVTKKFEDNFKVLGHRLPCGLSQEIFQEINCSLEAHFSALGYQAGPFDADLKIGESGVTVIEMAPRLGGNGVPIISSLHSGRDLVSESIALALGYKEQFTIGKSGQYASTLLGSASAGTVGRFPTLESLRAKDNRILQVEFNASCGDTVRQFTHGGEILGFAIFECASDSDFWEVSEIIHDEIDVHPTC